VAGESDLTGVSGKVSVGKRGVLSVSQRVFGGKVEELSEAEEGARVAGLAVAVRGPEPGAGRVLRNSHGGCRGAARVPEIR
jgi:hypothetical protein